MTSPTIDNTLGAVFIGNLITGILYGVTCVQAFLYFQNYPEDRLWLKLTVLFLWLCDTVGLALVTHGVYFYAVTNFANPAAFQDPTSTIMLHLMITVLSDAVVRSLFGQRLWILSGGNVPLASAIVITSLSAVGFGWGFTISAIILKTYANFIK